MTEREYQLFPAEDGGSFRSWITNHLRTHPDHAWFYQPGFDFAQDSSVNIARAHEWWHNNRSTFATHEHERPWRVLVRKGNAMKTKRLELKVTVEGEDPDGTLAAMTRQGPHPRPYTAQIQYGTRSLPVVKVERADGQAIGLEAHFEQYWAENHCEGDDGEEAEKSWAREAFFYGVRWAKEQK
jgi:hypothetical protein